MKSKYTAKIFPGLLSEIIENQLSSFNFYNFIEITPIFEIDARSRKKKFILRLEIFDDSSNTCVWKMAKCGPSSEIRISLERIS